MRIISGSAGKRHIRVPGSVARPSTDRLREALFSILGNRVQGAVVLDLFAGSGALGLECLSRGAASCLFVDDSREAQQVIKKNLSELKLDGGRVAAGDVFRLMNADRGSYDLIFADPPYFKSSGDTDYVDKLMSSQSFADRISTDGILVIEDDPRNKRDAYAGWVMLDQRKYGGCGILIYQRQPTS